MLIRNTKEKFLTFLRSYRLVQIMAKFYLVTHPLVNDLVRYAKHFLPNVKENVNPKVLRKIEMDILAAVNYDLLPVCGGTEDGTLEFMEAWQFDRSLASLGTTEKMSEQRETISYVNEHGEVNYVVSVQTRREKEIMHYWQASI